MASYLPVFNPSTHMHELHIASQYYHHQHHHHLHHATTPTAATMDSDSDDSFFFYTDLAEPSKREAFNDHTLPLVARWILSLPTFSLQEDEIEGTYLRVAQWAQSLPQFEARQVVIDLTACHMASLYTYLHRFDESLVISVVILIANHHYRDFDCGDDAFSDLWKSPSQTSSQASDLLMLRPIAVVSENDN